MISTQWRFWETKTTEIQTEIYWRRLEGWGAIKSVRERRFEVQVSKHPYVGVHGQRAPRWVAGVPSDRTGMGGPEGWYVTVGPRRGGGGFHFGLTPVFEEDEPKSCPWVSSARRIYAIFSQIHMDGALIHESLGSAYSLQSNPRIKAPIGLVALI